MAISRRNILIGLGALVGGGGALVSTGAFTTVSAERSVSVETSGDASAFLTITGTSQYVNDDSGSGTLTIDLGAPGQAGFNENAITTLSGVFEIANNAADGSDAEVSLSTTGTSNDPDTGSGTVSVELDDAEVTFYLGGIDSAGTQTLSTGDAAVAVDVEVDTTGSYSGGSSGNLTIVANEP
ncbi:hypothetical protein [Halobellus captivus]|uniref:hypothetical protein n=1 Tax=Halobellus captivus TaxID=2592614 RepID=UPI0011A6A686|nr:hypothetical protein [Halobellus captivus]